MLKIFYVFLFIVFSSQSFADLNSLKSKFPFYHSINSDKSKNGSEHQIQLLNDGVVALQKRIDLIRKAKKDIVLEYFIFNPDTSGKILLDELIKAAKKGVRVRILIDKSITIFKLDEFYSEFLNKFGVELYYYNRALDPITAQYRTHRKIFAIDNTEAIIGGRNIGVEYFDMSPEYNFMDRDLYIKGPIVETIMKSFDAYWENRDIVKVTVFPKEKSYRKLFKNSSARKRYELKQRKVIRRRRKEVKQWFNSFEDLAEIKYNVERIARPTIVKEPMLACPNVTFVSDLPGGTIKSSFNKEEYLQSHRLVTREIKRRLMDIQNIGDEFFISSPYFIPNDEWVGLFDHLLTNGKKVKLFTNSLQSTDAIYVSTMFYRVIQDWIEKGMDAYIHNADYAGILFDTPDKRAKTSRWGTHSKMQIFNDNSFMMGTYNIDNRSHFFNSEMGIFCDGAPELVKRLKEDTKKRFKVAHKILDESKSVDHEGNDHDIYGGAEESKVKLMKRIYVPVKILEPIL